MAGATPDEIARLVAELERERQTWIDGTFDPATTGPMVQDDAMTIFGPFGGEAAGPGPMQAKMSALFSGGTGRCELVRAIAEGDLLVLVLIERNVVSFGASPESEPWVLRTTQVFRRDGTQWRRLHRHADPLIVRRPLDATRAISAPPTAR